MGFGLAKREPLSVSSGASPVAVRLSTDATTFLSALFCSFFAAFLASLEGVVADTSAAADLLDDDKLFDETELEDTAGSNDWSSSPRAAIVPFGAHSR